ncbi:MAG: ABC-F family ATP-binding cassette domain-containing protein, partial [Bacteroidota bacterium]
FEEGKSVIDSIFDGGSEQAILIRSYEHALAQSATDEQSQAKLAELIEKMDAANLWDFESQVKQILGKLGIHNLDDTASKLSGGQKKRIALAKALIERPDFLILDEPTNHLDLEAIEWLENYLSTANMTLLIVTHDRYFLEKVTNKILEIDNQQVYSYKGSYGYFLEKKEEREAQETAEVEKAKNLLRKELEWMRRQPKARGTKAKYRVDAFYDLQEKASKKVAQNDLKLEVQQRRQGGKVLEIKHISKSFNETKVVDDFSYVFKKGDKVGIVGKNGSGKSTLLNIITEQIKPDEGEVIIGQTTQIGYYTQDELRFNPDHNVLDVVKEIAEVVQMGDGSVITASQFLQHFQFSPKKQYDKVAKLSGGEKRRLQLLKVLIRNPNFLILDEPTNDLDLVTLSILEDFLASFQGCLIIVSHDRYFLDRLVEHIFTFEVGKGIQDFPGNYTQYRLAKEEEESIKTVEKNRAKVDKVKTESKRRLSFKEKQEYESLQQEIEKLEGQKQELVERLNDGGADHTEMADWGRQVQELTELIDEKEMRWLELSEFVD